MKKAKRTAITVALVMIVLGLGMSLSALAASGFDVAQAGGKYVNQSYDIAEPFSAISVELVSADLDIVPARDGKTTLKARQDTNYTYTVEVRDGTLYITEFGIDSAIDFRKDEAELVLALGETSLGRFNFFSTSGDLELTGATFTEMIIESSSGEIDLERCDANTITITTASGDVSGEHFLSPKTYDVFTVSGEIELPRNQSGGLCSVKTTSGDIEFE